MSVRSFKKKNIRSFAEQLLVDTNKLCLFVHKILAMRLLACKCKLYIACRMLHNHSNLRTAYHTIYAATSHYVTYTAIQSFSSDRDDNAVVASYSTYLTRAVRNEHVWNTLRAYFCYIGCLMYNIYASHFDTCRGIAHLPTTVHKFTVLRSPHIDKKSREQFETRIYKRAFSFHSVYGMFYAHVCQLSYNYYLCHLVNTVSCMHEEFV
jgi:hypothetical protein